MGYGKICYGFYRAGGQEEQAKYVSRAVNSGAKAVFLFQDGMALGPAIRAAAPNMIIVARPRWFSDEVANLQLGPEAAREAAMSYCRNYPWATAFQYACETIPGAKPTDLEQQNEQRNGLELQASAELGFLDGLAAMGWTRANGRGGVVINAGPGIVPIGESQYQTDFWAEAIKPLVNHPAYRAFGVHLYGTGREVEGSRGQLSYGDLEQARWYSLRATFFREAMLAKGLDIGRVMATEIGQTDGWRGLMSEQEAIDDYLWYENQIRGLSWYEAAFCFLNSDHDPEKWHVFNLEDTQIEERIAMANKAVPAPAPEVTPEAPEAPKPYELAHAFRQWAKVHSGIAGQPTGPICYFKPVNTEGVQMITQNVQNGRLEYNEANGEVCFYPKWK